jgi:hypothetical protein
MPSIKASFDAFTTYHAAVAPVLGTDPAAVDAGLVEAALDAVLAKRPSPTSPEEHKAAYRHLRDLGEKSPLAFKLHYELHLKHQCNLAPIAIATESANVDDWEDDRICIKDKTMVGSVDVAAPTVLLTAIEPLAAHAVITTDPRNTSPEEATPRIPPEGVSRHPMKVTALGGSDRCGSCGSSRSSRPSGRAKMAPSSPRRPRSHMRQVRREKMVRCPRS